MIRNSKILIVDDEPCICKTLKTLLHRQSYDVYTCYNGDEALNFLLNNECDLVLQDVYMDGMDGFQLFDKIKNQKIDTPVIIMTGKASTDTAVKALRMGACDYLKKPFASQELFSAVKKVLDRKRESRENHSIDNKLKVSSKQYNALKNAFEKKIEAQKIAEEQKKMALVGQIAGKMAHDFNNVLAIIMGNAQLGLLDSKSPKTRKTFELIFQQTLRGKNLTKNLVAFARTQALKPKFFRLGETIDFVVTLMRESLENVELIREEMSELPELFADPGMIEHALVNIIQNSIHALSMVKYPKIIIRTYKSENNLCLEIEDNGCGIPKEYLQKVYEPSFTLKGSKDITRSYQDGIKGTGYGMANVKKYIEQHKGTIFIESVFGSGTKITIALPIIKRELTHSEKKALQNETVYCKKNILLVEDEQSLADLFYRVLTQEPCHHKVDIANSGQVAMELLDKNQYDLLSLDYILPGGSSGMDVYNHVRKSDKKVPVLFVSGNIEFLESINELKERDEHVEHISKPCQNRDYINSINKLLKKL